MRVAVPPAAPLEDGVTAVAGADLIDGVFDPLALAATGVGEIWRVGVGGVYQAAAADADQAKTSAVKLGPQQRFRNMKKDIGELGWRW